MKEINVYEEGRLHLRFIKGAYGAELAQLVIDASGNFPGKQPDIPGVGVIETDRVHMVKMLGRLYRQAKAQETKLRLQKIDNIKLGKVVT